MTDRTHDDRGRPIAVITGMGVVTALGVGKDDNWRALTDGRSGIRRIGRFPTDGLRTTIAAEIDFMGAEPRVATMCFDLAVLAVEEAIGEAGIGSRADFPGLLVTAVPPMELEWPERRAIAQSAAARAEGANRHITGLIAAAATGEWTDAFANVQRECVAERLADRFGTRGLPVSLSTACASGASAIQFGVEAIRRGEADAVLCVGTDATVNPESLVRFSLLSALSTHNDPPEGAARPFSRDRDGFVMGEGAAALVIESMESALARGAGMLGVVRGCGERADSFHRTRSNPDGSAIIGALENALADAGLPPGAIDYVNPHGTGTPENDKMEYLSLAAIFGDRLPEVPVSSNKSMIGHTLSAAGTIEAVFSLLTIATGTLPPTINYNTPDPDIPLDVVPNVKRDRQVATVLSNSFGFGGQNVSLVLAAEPH